MANRTTNPSNDIIFIRQESKVQKIEPEDEYDPFLKKSDDAKTDIKTSQKKPRPEKLVTFTNDDSKDNDVNSARELKVNGNVVIYMPPKDNHCNNEMIKYQNENGLVTPLSFDHVDGPQFPKKKQNQRCSCLGPVLTRNQTYVNLALALGCAIGLFLGIWSYIKTSTDSDNKTNLYCYPCDATKNIQEKVRKGNMCCISDPIKDYKESTNFPSLGSDHETYNGSRIVEFEADFSADWVSKDQIHWSTSESISTNSFISHQPNAGQLTFTHEGTYVITLSLTTNTYSDNVDQKYIRVVVCLVFETAIGDKSDECRLITHTRITNIPFQIVKYSEVKNGTKISTTITDRDALKSSNIHNKLFIVML